MLDSLCVWGEEENKSDPVAARARPVSNPASARGRAAKKKKGSKRRRGKSAEKKAQSPSPTRLGIPGFGDASTIEPPDVMREGHMLEAQSTRGTRDVVGLAAPGSASSKRELLLQDSRTLTRRKSQSLGKFGQDQAAFSPYYIAKHLTLFLGAIMLVGAVLYFCEKDKEKEDRKALKKKIIAIQRDFGQLYDFAATNATVLAVVDDLRRRAITTSCDLRPGYVYWTWPGAVFFVTTLVTTIGYGTFAPQTPWGKVASSVICVFGVAYFGYILNLTGAAVHEAVKQSQRFFRKVLRRPKHKRKHHGLARACFVWAVLYIVVVALGAQQAGVMTFGNAAYMGVVTFTTVGLGDFAPPLIRGEATRDQVMRQYVYGSVVALIGLTLLSALISSINLEKQSTSLPSTRTPRR
ncbi:potassium channel [Aureococcus anophagefferens]|nr:potassium channel [Aureococcus anophagefferens]